MSFETSRIERRLSVAEKMNFARMIYYVESKLSSDLRSELTEYVNSHPRVAELWGQEQPNKFIETMVCTALYKDLSALGYSKIIQDVNFGFSIQAKSLSHNVKLIREMLMEWAKKQIVNEKKQAWNASSKILPKKKELKQVNLFMDSTDFRLAGKVLVSRKDSRWSYKLNSPGQRFQVLCDAKEIVQKVWGRYSPKIYDGHWIEIMAEELGLQFSGAFIIADTHYETANNILSRFKMQKRIRFYTPIAQPRGRKLKKNENLPNDLSRGACVLTKEQQLYNKRHAHVRARVESPFGLIKMKWQGLSKPFFEKEYQQTLLVYIALGIHNYFIGASQQNE